MPCQGPSPYEIDITYEREMHRATRVACELASILRKDHNLFAKVSRRTKRWIKKHDALDKARKDAQDKALRIAKRKKVALSKLTKKEQALLGLYNPDEVEDDD
jgi:hypothetical protein